MTRGKKGLSEVVGYVLLIVVAISVAAIVGVWMMSQVPEDDSGKICPEDSSLIILDYNCTRDIGSLIANITIKNKGFFVVDGFTLKYNNLPDGKIGIISLGNDSSPNSRWGKKMAPEEIYSFKYNLAYNSFRGEVLESGLNPQDQSIYLLELQPFTIYRGEKNFCEKVSYKEINKADCIF
jgi:flagellin-like protein